MSSFPLVIFIGLYRSQAIHTVQLLWFTLYNTTEHLNMKFLALFLRDLRSLVKGQQKETVQKSHRGKNKAESEGWIFLCRSLIFSPRDRLVLVLTIRKAGSGANFFFFYGKRQTSDSIWDFLKIESEQVKTVPNNNIILRDKTGVKLLIFFFCKTNTFAVWRKRGSKSL